MHLFFECDFSQKIWWKLRMEWNTEMPLIEMLIEGNRGKTIFALEKC
jgi:hypothetical protein